MVRRHRLVSRVSWILALVAPLAVMLLVAAPAFAAAGTVSIFGFAYNPSSVTITVGDSVEWTNDDGVSHTVTADDASFGSGSLGPGAGFTWTFSSAGTFDYHCAIHPTMTGTVTVQVPTTAAPGSGATAPPTSTSPASPDDAQPSSSWLFVLLALAGVAGVLFAATDLTPRRRG